MLEVKNLEKAFGKKNSLLLAQNEEQKLLLRFKIFLNKH